MNLLDELATVLEARKHESPESSYVASLYQGGTNRILQKIGEESAELIIAGKDHSATIELQNNPARDEVVKETADLWFHCMVLLAHQGLSHNDVLAELSTRFGISGHDEKASRST
ncbi:MAG: phosphoribosyl-ATP diphosphatase [Pseudomonadaceae bacterium]|nr:phosphoribosyl-ATP diphosphatase [Pseudomonadaceae bacterium]